MSDSKGFAAAAHEWTCGMAVMCKASYAGRTKTRLVPPLSGLEAAEANTAFLKDTFANIAAAEAYAPLTGYAAYGAPGTEAFFDDVLPAGVGRFPACAPGFGECLQFALAHLFAQGHGGAAVLNGDSPTLPPHLLSEMARLLAQPGDRGVLGPSIDGGYYLLALKAPHPELFADIAWSTDQVAGQTLARAEAIGLPLHILPSWYDVDDAAALHTLHGELFAGRPFGDPALARGAATHSRALLQRLLAETPLAARLGLSPAAERVAETAPGLRRAS